MMKLVCAAVVLFGSMVATASAGEVSKSTLNSMGLSAMKVMSANDGLAIRGKGTSASVWGTSQANFFGGQHSENSYQASSSHYQGSSLAVGGSISVAGAAVGHDGNISFIVVGAAGGAFAFAR